MHQTQSSFSSHSFSSSFPSSPALSPALPSALPSAHAPSDPQGFDASASLGRLQPLVDILDRYLRLPDSPRAFFLYLAALILVSSGATLYVVIAAQILQAEVQVARLEQQLAGVEQQNGDILWKIARETNMAHLHARITALGYTPIQQREYIIVTEDAAPLAVQPQAEPAPQVLSPASVAQRPPAAWQSFFAQRWRAASTPALTTGQIRLPVASEADPAADTWRLWWEQTLDRSAAMLQQFAGR